MQLRISHSITYISKRIFNVQIFMGTQQIISIEVQYYTDPAGAMVMPPFMYGCLCCGIIAIPVDLRGGTDVVKYYSADTDVN